MKKLFFIIVAILISISTPQIAFAIEYPDINIYYDNYKYIYSYNLYTQKREKILVGHSPVLSHDKNLLAYSIDGAKINASTSVSDIYIYDIKNQKTKFVFANDPTYFPWLYYQSNWSTNDQYLTIVQNDEAQIYSIQIYDTKIGKITQQFASSDNFLWINNHEILINTLQSDIKPGRPTSVGTPSSIAIFNIETGISYILKQATPTEDYYFMTDDNKNIIMVKTVWKLEKINQKDYLTNILDRKYYIINTKGNIIKEIEEPYQKIRDNSMELEDEINKILLSQFINYKYIKPMQLIGNWFILSLSNDYQHNSDFFILDKTNPNSLKKIGEGNSITW